MAPFHTLVAAVHTPFAADGSLNLTAVEAQASHLRKTGVGAVFVGGTTGESASLTVEERLALTERWLSVARGSGLRVIVHVGSNCLSDARTMAAAAQRGGAAAISAVAPSYFKPASVDALAACCAEIAAAAPETPYYHYDIPALTGVSLPMPAFLEKAATAVPTLAGLKFTTPDLMSYLQCLHSGGWDIPWGIDEWMLGALATGARGFVGSTFNFSAPVSLALWRAFDANDFATARERQLRNARLIALLARHGYMAAAKATMGFLGIDVGPPRLPNSRLTPGAAVSLRQELETLGFFDWITP